MNARSRIRGLARRHVFVPLGTSSPLLVFFDKVLRRAFSPPLRGVAARSIEYCEATLARADGVVLGVADNVATPSTTPSAPLRNGAILLMSQPPLLGEEGKGRQPQPVWLRLRRAVSLWHYIWSV